MPTEPLYAFPQTTDVGARVRGMLLRDWFAGQALSGLLADPSGETVGAKAQTFAATVAYGMADAMLEARKK
jgi:hypothetical protein